jgi:hypothetical protein
MAKATKVTAPKAVKKTATKKAPVKKQISVKSEPKKVVEKQISFFHLDCVLEKNIKVDVAMQGNDDVLIISLVEAMLQDEKIANLVLKSATEFVQDKLKQAVLKATAPKKSKVKK